MDDTSFLDWPFFEDYHRAYANKLCVWCQDELSCLPTQDSVKYCRLVHRALGQAGWLESIVNEPEIYRAFDLRKICLTRDILARYSGVADFVYAQHGLGVSPLSLFGVGEQQKVWLPRARSGQLVATFAFAEPESGADLSTMSCEATREGAHWLLNGEKTWVPLAGLADVYVVLARTGELGTRGLSVFVISADAPGIDVVESLETIAAHPTYRVRFDNVRAPALALIREEGTGASIVERVHQLLAGSVGASVLGVMRSALSEVRRKEEESQEGSVGSDKDTITRITAIVKSATLMVYEAAWRQDMGLATGFEDALAAKSYALCQAPQVLDGAAGLFMRKGLFADSPLEVLVRQMRALRFHDGATDVSSLFS